MLASPKKMEKEKASKDDPKSISILGKQRASYRDQLEQAAKAAAKDFVEKARPERRMLCFCVLHVLRHFVHWNCCIEEMRSMLQLLEFEGSLARKRRFHFFNSWNSKEASHESFVFTNQGWDMNVRICAKHCVFSGKRSFRCREKLARLRDGCGRRRFAFDSCSVCARHGTDGSRRLFLFFDDAVLLCFACVETLCALELLH